MTTDDLTLVGQNQQEFPCRQCGANMQFAPGTVSLKCPYCGCQQAVAPPIDEVFELDFLTSLSHDQSREAVTAVVVKCTACGAETSLAQNITSDMCPFCGSPIVAQSASRRLIKPQALLPFRITREQASASFVRWIAGLWFAPSALKATARTKSSSLAGMYVPYWTYDCETITQYTGQRGDAYWVTEHYTVTINGKTQHRSRQVRKIRWSYASGTVTNGFDDVLVLASNSLPRKHTQALEPWDLRALEPYNDQFLAGFRAEAYQVGLAGGFEIAKTIMDGPIRQTICRDIGGDEQRIDSMQVQYRNITFKHILLPVWISAYRYRDRVFRFLVNARTGEVQGERPWSAWKIAIAVFAVAALVAMILLLVNYARNHG